MADRDAILAALQARWPGAQPVHDDMDQLAWCGFAVTDRVFLMEHRVSWPRQMFVIKLDQRAAADRRPPFGMLTSDVCEPYGELIDEQTATTEEIVAALAAAEAALVA